MFSFLKKLGGKSKQSKLDVKRKASAKSDRPKSNADAILAQKHIPPNPRGNKFTIEGVTIYALNRKNALRKYNNLVASSPGLRTLTIDEAFPKTLSNESN